MTEENEVVHEQEAPVQEVQEQAQEQAKQESVKQVPDDAEVNWKRANEVLRLQKQRIEELETKLTQQVPKAPEEKDEFADLDPDDYLTVAKARELAKKTASREAQEAAKKIVKEYVQQQNVENDENRCRTKYEDYDFVLENFALPLIKNDPALAYRVQNSKNPAETAYKLGKLSDDYEGSMTKQQTSAKAEKVLKNTSRPVSGNAVGSPLKTQADQFSKMSKEEVWSMSQKYARGA